jgi:hypothetical protein
LRFLVISMGLIAVAILTLSATRPSAAPADRQQQVHHQKQQHQAVSCRSSRVAIPWYRKATNSWQRKRQATQLAGPEPRARGHSCGYVRWAAKEWQARARAARRTYLKWKAQWGRDIALLNRGLAGTRWSGLGSFLVRAGRETGISPFFAAGVAETESTIGEAACGYGGYNAWGLGNCAGAWNVPTFHSWYEAIPWWMRYVRKNWPSARTPYDFYGYAASTSSWGNSVSEHVRSRFGVTARVRYP